MRIYTNRFRFVCLVLSLVLIMTLTGCHEAKKDGTLSSSITTQPSTDASTPVTEPSGSAPTPTVPPETTAPPTTEPSEPPPPPETSEPTKPSKPVTTTKPSSPIISGHKHTYAATVTAPKCDEDGYTTYYCSCGDWYEDDVVEAPGHEWDEWIITRSPSEFEMGKEERNCLTCGEIGSRFVPNFNHSYWDDTRTYQTGVMEYNFDTIPDYMLDSMILRALAFTGYDVQFLKEQKLLYHPDYVGHGLEKNQELLRPDPILTGIKYNNKGKWGGITKPATTEKELAATVTGKVPNMPAHLENGMYCTSFVDYFLFAYLPNCEGIDTSAIERIQANAAKRFANGTYTYMDLWTEAFEGKNGLVQQGLATHYEINVKASQKHTAEYNEIWRKIQPGTIIRFGNNVFPYIHYAIYVGTYNNLHYIAHVGNDRGPEIVIAESMGVEASDDPSWPIDFYDLHLEDIQKGSIQIVKSEKTTGQKVAGAYFKAVDLQSGKEFYFCPTTEEGYTILHGLSYGTYSVYEIAAPDGFTEDPRVFAVTVSKEKDLITIISTS